MFPLMGETIISTSCLVIWGGGFLVAEKMDFYMKHDLGNVEANGHENKDRSGYQKACRGKIAPI